MVLVYSTNDVHPSDAVAYWTEVITRRFYNTMLPQNAGEPFEAELRTGELGFLRIASHACSPYIGAHTQREICLADCSVYHVCLQLAGMSAYIEDDREIVVRPGNFFILDPSRPFIGHYRETCQQIAVAIPRTKIDAHFGDVPDLTSRAFSGQNPIAEMMFGFLAMLPERMNTLENAAAMKIADHAVDLVILAIQAELRDCNQAPASPRSSALVMLKLAVDTRLRDPSLKPATAAAAAGISVRYANSLFAEEGTGLERYIIVRRLEQARKTLEDPSQSHRTISEIAFSWGFTDVSHFSRRFKAAYGRTPGEYRKLPLPIARTS